MTPLVLSFSTAEALKISEHLDILNGVDLHLEPFGQNSFVLSEHPTWFVEGQEEATAKEMIDWILSDTISDFRPPISLSNRNIVYLNSLYYTGLTKFLGSIIKKNKVNII